MSHTGPAHLAHTPGNLIPLATPSKGPGVVAAGLTDDIIRANATYVRVPQASFNLYTNQPTIISHARNFRLINDPLDYEMEYKRRNIWTIKDIRVFIVTLLKHNKRMEQIGEALPHKTAKEIVFFYHGFKKLLNFKHEVKQARELLKMRGSQSSDLAFQKQADLILEPLIQHAKKQKVCVERDAFLTPPTPQAQKLQQKGHSMHQRYFNVEELLQVFSASCTTSRRRPKSYATLNDSMVGHNAGVGLYQHNTFKIKPEFLGCPELKQGDDLMEHYRQQDLGGVCDLGQTEAMSRSGLKTLRKIDYMEYVERTGRATLSYLVDQKEAVNHQTDQLRFALQQRHAQYSYADYDNWRLVNYLRTPQAQLCLAGNESASRRPVDEKPTRDLEDHVLFQYSLPQRDAKGMAGARRKSREQGFTQQFSADFQ